MATLPQPLDDNIQSFSIEYEQEPDGRWLAEVPDLPGVMAYAKTKEDAEVEVTALALRVIADPAPRQKQQLGPAGRMGPGSFLSPNYIREIGSAAFVASLH